VTRPTKIVHGYIGDCDDDAARAGIEWMRDKYRARGEAPRFGALTVRLVTVGVN
jgi:hypothetical protein